jgi:hypothetical protein
MGGGLDFALDRFLTAGSSHHLPEISKVSLLIATLPLWTKEGGVTGGWRKLHDEELRNLYSSPSIIRIIKSRRMRWAGHLA